TRTHYQYLIKNLPLKGVPLRGVGFLSNHSETGLSHCYHEGSQPLMKGGETHVSPAWIIRMDRCSVNPHAAPQCPAGARVGYSGFINAAAAFQCPAGARVGPVELWDCADPVVRAPDRGHVSGPADAAEGRHGRTAALRMVLPGRPQSGGQAADGGRHDVFSALVALGSHLVGQYADGPGPRRDELGSPLCGVDGQRGVL